MWLNLPSLLFLDLRVRARLRRFGFAAALSAFSKPNPKQRPDLLKAASTELGAAELAFAQSAALWLRRFANLPKRLPRFGRWMNRVLGPSACLDQAIALRAFLHARGLPAELKIGTRRRSADQGFTAHAWVELAGIALGEPADANAQHVLFEGRL